MTYEEAKNLIPEKSYVKFAEGKYRFAGLYHESHFLRRVHLMIYDEEPHNKHVDSILIESCEKFD